MPLFTELSSFCELCCWDPTNPVIADLVHSEFQLNHYKNPAGFLQRSSQCTQMYIHLYIFTMQDKQYELLIKNSSCEPGIIYTPEKTFI